MELNRVLFEIPFNLHFFKSEKEFKNWCKKRGFEDEPPRFVVKGSNGSVHKIETGGVIDVVVTMDENGLEYNTSNEIMALLVHEAMHVWQYVLEYIGEHKPSYEFEAYMVQKICLKLFDAYTGA